MRISAFSVLALGFGLTGFQLSACSNSSEDCNATATCVTSAGSASAGKSNGTGGGDDAGASAGGASPIGGSSNTSGVSGVSGTMGVGGEGGARSGACSGDVSDDAACWTTNELGVFVSSETGDDAAGDGTKEAPFKTITKGVTSAGGKNVYVCVGAGDYAEKISIDAATDGLRLYGGFECSNWTYATTRSAQIVSPTNIALRIDGLKKGAYIENVRFQAADGAGLDASSYGAFVTSSAKVMLKRVELKAGRGLKGADGDPGKKGPNGSAAGVAPAGTDGVCVPDPVPVRAGGKWSQDACGSQGGGGGTGVKNVTTAQSGLAGSPAEHVNPLSGIENGGLGSTDGTRGKDGDDGMEGDPGSLGANASALGSFKATGFASADGHDGADAYPGQGGGGGGASKGTALCFGASGGAGGMGGCGGTAGFGAKGGGASVGLLSWGSDVDLQGCQVASTDGGPGGKGGDGGGSGTGAAGGGAGNPDPANVVKAGGGGGRGGNGGNGGSGSGGTGGPSYGIVFSGTRPVYTAPDTTVTVGSGGAAGVGGKVLTAKAPDGAIGASAVEFEVK